MSRSPFELDLDFTSIPDGAVDGVDVENSVGMPEMGASCTTGTPASCDSDAGRKPYDPSENPPQE